MSATIFEGGCLCGAVRYRTTGEPHHLTHCHCMDCRKASGAPFVSWVSFKSQDFTITHGNPARLSWATRQRTFCNQCGTPLTFQIAEDSEEIDVTICSVDHPERLVPQDHTWVEDRLPWITLSDGLPCYERQRGPILDTQFPINPLGPIKSQSLF